MQLSEEKTEEYIQRIDLSTHPLYLSIQHNKIILQETEDKVLPEGTPPHRIKYKKDRITNFTNIIKREEALFKSYIQAIREKIQNDFGSLISISLTRLLTKPTPLSFLQELVRTSDIPPRKAEDVNVFIVAHGEVVEGVLHVSGKERILSYNPPGLLGWLFTSDIYWDDSNHLGLPLRYKDRSAQTFLEKTIYKEFYQLKEYQYFPNCVLSSPTEENDTLFFKETGQLKHIRGCDAAGVYIYYKGHEEKFEFIPLETMFEATRNDKHLSVALDYIKRHIDLYYPDAKKISYLNFCCTSVFSLKGLDMLSLFNVYIHFFTPDTKKRAQLRLYLQRLFRIKPTIVQASFPISYEEESKTAYLNPIDAAEAAANSSPRSGPSQELIELTHSLELLSLFELDEKIRFMNDILITLDNLQTTSEHYLTFTRNVSDVAYIHAEISNLSQWIQILLDEKNRLVTLLPPAGRLHRIQKQGSKLKRKKQSSIKNKKTKSRKQKRLLKKNRN